MVAMNFFPCVKDGQFNEHVANYCSPIVAPAFTYQQAIYLLIVMSMGREGGSRTSDVAIITICQWQGGAGCRLVVDLLIELMGVGLISHHHRQVTEYIIIVASERGGRGSTLVVLVSWCWLLIVCLKQIDKMTRGCWTPRCCLNLNLDSQYLDIHGIFYIVNGIFITWIVFEDRPQNAMMCRWVSNYSKLY